MAYTLTQNPTPVSDGGAGTSIAATFAGAVASGSLLVAVVTMGADHTGGDITVTDDKTGGSNAWTNRVEIYEGPGTNATIAIFFAIAGSAEALTITSNFTEAAFRAIHIMEWAGNHATPSDNVVSNTGVGSAINPGTLTPSQDNCVIIFAELDGTGPTRVLNGLTKVMDDATTFACDGYVVQTTATGKSAWVTTPATATWGAVAAAFKAAAGGGGGVGSAVYFMRRRFVS